MNGTQRLESPWVRDSKDAQQCPDASQVVRIKRLKICASQAQDGNVGQGLHKSTEACKHKSTLLFRMRSLNRCAGESKFSSSEFFFCFPL